MEWTTDLKPCQYVVILRYRDANSVSVGLARLLISDGTLVRRLGKEDGLDVWTDLQGKVEEGKTPDEIVEFLEAKGCDQCFADAWASHIPMPEEEVA